MQPVDYPIESHRARLDRELREMYLDPDFIDWWREREAEAIQAIDKDREYKIKWGEIDEPK